MAINARREGDSILVDGVDFKRLARKLRALTEHPDWKAPRDMDAALQLSARMLGYANLHELNEAAGKASTPPVDPRRLTIDPVSGRVGLPTSRPIVVAEPHGEPPGDPADGVVRENVRRAHKGEEIDAPLVRLHKNAIDLDPLRSEALAYKKASDSTKHADAPEQLVLYERSKVPAVPAGLAMALSNVQLQREDVVFAVGKSQSSKAKLALAIPDDHKMRIIDFRTGKGVSLGELLQKQGGLGTVHFLDEPHHTHAHLLSAAAFVINSSTKCVVLVPTTEEVRRFMAVYGTMGAAGAVAHILNLDELTLEQRRLPRLRASAATSPPSAAIDAQAVGRTEATRRPKP